MSLADQLRKLHGANKEQVDADAPSSSLLAIFNGSPSPAPPASRKRSRNTEETEELLATPPTKKLRRQVEPNPPAEEEEDSSDEESSQEEEDDELSTGSVDESNPTDQVPEAALPEETQLTEEEIAAQKAARRERDQRTLFLGNLPTNTKKKVCFPFLPYQGNDLLIERGFSHRVGFTGLVQYLW